MPEIHGYEGKTSCAFVYVEIRNSEADSSSIHYAKAVKFWHKLYKKDLIFANIVQGNEYDPIHI